jgi:hypothetical protein
LDLNIRDLLVDERYSPLSILPLASSSELGGDGDFGLARFDLVT